MQELELHSMLMEIEMHWYMEETCKCDITLGCMQMVLGWPVLCWPDSAVRGCSSIATVQLLQCTSW